MLLLFCFLCLSVLKSRHLRRRQRWLSFLKFVPKRRKSFHHSDDLDNLHWTETKESEHEVLRIFICSVCWNNTPNWAKMMLSSKVHQQKMLLNVSMLISDIINAQMSFLLSALLLWHLLNPEHQCLLGALTSWKLHSVCHHLLLCGHHASQNGNFSIYSYLS